MSKPTYKLIKERLGVFTVLLYIAYSVMYRLHLSVNSYLVLFLFSIIMTGYAMYVLRFFWINRVSLGRINKNLIEIVISLLTNLGLSVLIFDLVF